ncbi:MAG: RNA-directed DNA polymerase [Pseudomonadota bacterium]
MATSPRSKKQRLELLLSLGFFPAQVPTCFTSQKFSSVAVEVGKKWRAINAHRCKEECAYERYSVARVGHNRRPICIPNPAAQYFLSDCISDNWRIINNKFSKSKLSVSIPKLGAEIGRAISITPIRDLNEIKLLQSVKHRYCLNTDISQFFPSIYTHAISWATEGKEIAKKKANRNNRTLLGPKLDELCRYTQSNQTIGIPIGPDTSHILAELVGSAIDLEIKKTLGKWPHGFRHVDDFSLYFETENEALRALTAISSALATYELKINIQKTKVSPIEESSSDSWTHQFDSFIFSVKRQSQRKDIHRFFDLTFSLAKSNEDESVIQYALRRIETEIIKSSNWEIFQAYLLRCMDCYPNTIPECALIISTYIQHIPAIVLKTKNQWKDYLSSRLAEHAPLAHHSEVAWLLWLSLRLGIKINSKAVTQIESMRSSICLLLALALESNKLLARRLSRKALPSLNSPDSLYGEYWLLMYEGAIKGWLPASLPAIQADPYFSELENKHVEFIDLNLFPTPIFTKKASAPNVDSFDTDEDVYQWFDFRESDEDYLGRRSMYFAEEEDDDEEEVATDEGNDFDFF